MNQGQFCSNALVYTIVITFKRIIIYLVFYYTKKYFNIEATPNPVACLAPDLFPPEFPNATPAISKWVQDTFLSTKYLRNSAASIAPPHLYLEELTISELFPLSPSDILWSKGICQIYSSN